MTISALFRNISPLRQKPTQTQIKKTEQKSTHTSHYVSTRLQGSEKLEAKNPLLEKNKTTTPTISYNHYTKPEKSLQKVEKINKLIETCKQAGIKITKTILTQNGITTTDYNLHRQNLSIAHLKPNVQTEHPTSKKDLTKTSTQSIFKSIDSKLISNLEISKNYTAIKKIIDSHPKTNLSKFHNDYISTALDAVCISSMGVGAGFGGFLFGGPVGAAVAGTVGLFLGSAVSFGLGKAVKQLIIKPTQKAINFTSKVQLHTSLLELGPVAK